MTVDFAVKPDYPYAGSGAIPLYLPSPGGNDWRAIKYCDGVWLAVALNGANRVARSVDNGLNWTTHAAASVHLWDGLAYGNGVAVAVGFDACNVCMRSTDKGLSWANIAMPSGRQWKAVTYGNGVFIAVAEDGLAAQQIARSTDFGLTWNAVASPVALQWSAVAYGHGVFVASALNGGGNQIMRSVDGGVTWVSAAEAATLQWWDINYSPNLGRWLSVSNDSVLNNVQYSDDDGATWIQAVKPNLLSDWTCCVWGRDRWVLSGSNGWTGLSPDGRVIANLPLSDNLTWWDIDYGAGRFISIGAASAPFRIA